MARRSRTVAAERPRFSTAGRSAVTRPAISDDTEDPERERERSRRYYAANREAVLERAALKRGSSSFSSSVRGYLFGTGRDMTDPSGKINLGHPTRGEAPDPLAEMLQHLQNFQLLALSGKVQPRTEFHVAMGRLLEGVVATIAVLQDETPREVCEEAFSLAPSDEEWRTKMLPERRELAESLEVRWPAP